MPKLRLIVLLIMTIASAAIVQGDWTKAELNTGYIVFEYSTLKNLSPGLVPTRDAIAKKLSCELATNEYESIQFGIHALADEIKTLEVEVESDLDVTVYCRISPEIKDQLEAAPNDAGEVRGWMLSEIHLQRSNIFDALGKGQSVNFWLTFRARRDTPPGVHVGKVRIKAATKPETVLDLEINVRPFELQRPRVSFGMWFREDMLPKRFGGLDTPKETVLAIYKDMVAHEQNACVFYPNASFHPLPPNDHHVLHKLLPLAKEAGLFQEPHVLSLILGGITDADPAKTRASVDWLTAERAKQGWPEFVGFAADEPHYPLDATRVEKACTPLVGLPMRMSLDQSNIAAVYGYSVPNLCDVQTVNDGVISEEVMEEANRMGIEMLTYSYSVWRESFDPLVQRYFAGMHTWALKLRGNWIWAYHHEHHRHAWFAPNSQEPMPVTGWEARREGVDDYRYLQMLEDAIAAQPQAALAMEAAAWLNELRTRCKLILPLDVRDGTPLTYDEYDEIRTRIAGYIERLGPIATTAAPGPAPRVQDVAARFRGQAVGLCTAALDSPDVASRRAAAWALFERGPEAAPAVNALATLLDDPEVRMPAMHALEAIGPDAHEAVPQIAQQLAHPDSYVRMGALLTLGAIGCPVGKREPDGVRSPSAHAASVIHPLATALQDDHKDISERAAEMLGVMGDLAAPAVSAAARLLNDPSLSKRRAGVSLIERLGPHASMAATELAMLHQESPGDPGYINALAAIGPAATAAVPALMQYASREYPGTKQADSYYALVRIQGNPMDLQNLVDLLKNDKVNAGTKNHVVGLLEKLGPKTAPLADEIRELTKDGKFTDEDKTSGFGKTLPEQAHYIDGENCRQLMPDLDLAERLPLGGWWFKDDPKNVGVAQGWFKTDFSIADQKEFRIGAFWDDQGYKGLGEGWYTLQYKCPELPDGKRVYVLFEAVDEGAWLYIDGTLVAWYDTAYPDITWSKPFLLDVTGALKSGSTHRLTIRVDNYSGAGGLYKPVSVMVER